MNPNNLKQKRMLVWSFVYRWKQEAVGWWWVCGTLQAARGTRQWPECTTGEKTTIVFTNAHPLRLRLRGWVKLIPHSPALTHVRIYLPTMAWVDARDCVIRFHLAVISGVETFKSSCRSWILYIEDWKSQQQKWWLWDLSTSICRLRIVRLCLSNTQRSLNM